VVRVTIYIEGGSTNSSLNPEADTVDNSIFFRESFHKLLSQKLSNDQFDLSIQPIGSISQARQQLQSITAQKINGIILIDLDGPKNEKEERLKANYNSLDTTKIFFMIQEMESWILSQPAQIDECFAKAGCIRKRQRDNIEDNTLLKNKHPEDIKAPSIVLNTILSQYFNIVKTNTVGPKYRQKNILKAKMVPI
jgi:hypothetical protein